MISIVSEAVWFFEMHLVCDMLCSLKGKIDIDCLGLIWSEKADSMDAL